MALKSNRILLSFDNLGGHMTKLSEIISLPVYSIIDRKKIGNIENVLLDKKRVKYYILYDENSDLKYLLNPQKIYGQTSFCITIKNTQSLLLLESEEKAISLLSNPINSTAISSLGKYYGRVKDVIIDKTNITEIIADMPILCEKILYLGENLTLIKSRENEKLSNFSIKTPKFKDDKSSKVTIQHSSTPLREIVNNNILIGRKTTQDILGINNEILVRSGTIINNRILNKIKYSGKLKELTLYSK